MCILFKSMMPFQVKVERWLFTEYPFGESTEGSVMYLVVIGYTRYVPPQLIIVHILFMPFRGILILWGKKGFTLLLQLKLDIILQNSLEWEMIQHVLK